jgi:hypothetical protein
MLDVIANNQIGVYWGPGFFIAILFYYVYIYTHCFLAYCFYYYWILLIMKWLYAHFLWNGFMHIVHVKQSQFFSDRKQCSIALRDASANLCVACQRFSWRKGYLRAAWGSTAKIDHQWNTCCCQHFFWYPNIFGVDVHKTNAFRGLPIG